jgi:zearalenone synthase (highly reducing iterative type I polyketide synthase)
MYKSLESIGLEYGPAFSNVRQVHNSSGQSFGLVEIPDLKSRIMDNCDRPHIIHPGTLDAVFHLAFAALMNDAILTAMVPKFIAEVTVSTDIPWLPGTSLPGFALSQRHGLRDVTAGIIMLDHLENSPLVNIQGLELTEVVGGSSNNGSPGSSKSIASKLTWRPAVDLLTSAQLLAQLETFKGVETLIEASS